MDKTKRERSRSRSRSRSSNGSSKDSNIIKSSDETAFLLDSRKRLTIRKFKNKLLVDIREFYDDNGTLKPGKKGISLSVDNWKQIKKYMEKIDKEIERQQK